jgi:formamidopyrimidine-DNA glycosylase
VPELPEVEAYRVLAEQRGLGRRIAAVEAPDPWYLKRGLDAAGAGDALIGRSVVSARRRGKLMLLDLGDPSDDGQFPPELAAPESVLGLHFGMSGRLLVDGAAGTDRLLYGGGLDHSRYDRFSLLFDDGGAMVMRDPRRLGAVLLDPDEDLLGPDALHATLADVRSALGHTGVAVKARLLDQTRIAGVGNLIADEVLWRAALAPARPSNSLTDADIRRLQRHLVSGLADLIRRGGSHMGDLQPERRLGGTCPRDRAELSRAVVGGRTTWWCPRHQH